MTTRDLITVQKELPTDHSTKFTPIPPWEFDSKIAGGIYKSYLDAKQVTVVVVNGNYPLGGQLTPTGIIRCLTLAMAFLDGKFPPNTWFIFSGKRHDGHQKSEAQLMYEKTDEFLRDFIRALPADRVLLEEQAGNTDDNARFSSALIQEEIEKKHGLYPKVIRPATNRPHFFRQEVTSAVIPQRGEWRHYMRKWPEASLVPLEAPDPWESDNDPNKRVLNSIHQATHYAFTPLIVNLYYVKDLLNPDQGDEGIDPETQEEGIARVIEDALMFMHIGYNQLYRLKGALHDWPNPPHQVQEVNTRFPRVLEDLHKALDMLEKYLVRDIPSLNKIEQLLKLVRNPIMSEEKTKKVNVGKNKYEKRIIKIEGLRYLSQCDRLS